MLRGNDSDIHFKEQCQWEEALNWSATPTTPRPPNGSAYTASMIASFAFQACALRKTASKRRSNPGMPPRRGLTLRTHVISERLQKKREWPSAPWGLWLGSVLRRWWRISRMHQVQRGRGLYSGAIRHPWQSTGPEKCWFGFQTLGIMTFYWSGGYERVVLLSHSTVPESGTLNKKKKKDKLQ